MENCFSYFFISEDFLSTHASVFFLTGGAAVKAGVQEGDRIIKVFTTLVGKTESESCWFPPVCCLSSPFPSVSLSQVNGSLVSSMSHQEVVKLIKCEF